MCKRTCNVQRMLSKCKIQIGRRYERYKLSSLSSFNWRKWNQILDCRKNARKIAIEMSIRKVRLPNWTSKDRTWKSSDFMYISSYKMYLTKLSKKDNDGTLFSTLCDTWHCTIDFTISDKCSRKFECSTRKPHFEGNPFMAFSLWLRTFLPKDCKKERRSVAFLGLLLWRIWRSSKICLWLHYFKPR